MAQNGQVGLPFPASKSVKEIIFNLSSRLESAMTKILAL